MRNSLQPANTRRAGGDIDQVVNQSFIEIIYNTFPLRKNGRKSDPITIR